MKKAILALALIMSMEANQVSLAASAPKHRFQPKTEQVDNRAVEAYSDTTSTDTTSYADDEEDEAPTYHSKYSLGNYDDPFDFFGSVFGNGVLMFVIILCVIIGLLIVFAPLIIIIMIIRYLIRRHNDRVKLAEMAMEKGANIPESERPTVIQSDEYLVKRGLRTVFVGLGLCVMFACWGEDFMVGIGGLIFFLGLGKVVIGSLPNIKAWWKKRNDKDSNLNAPMQ